MAERRHKAMDTWPEAGRTITTPASEFYEYLAGESSVPCFTAVVKSASYFVVGFILGIWEDRQEMGGNVQRERANWQIYTDVIRDYSFISLILFFLIHRVQPITSINDTNDNDAMATIDCSVLTPSSSLLLFLLLFTHVLTTHVVHTALAPCNRRRSWSASHYRVYEKWQVCETCLTFLLRARITSSLAPSLASSRRWTTARAFNCSCVVILGGAAGADEINWWNILVWQIQREVRPPAPPAVLRRDTERCSTRPRQLQGVEHPTTRQAPSRWRAAFLTSHPFGFWARISFSLCFFFLCFILVFIQLLHNIENLFTRVKYVVITWLIRGFKALIMSFNIHEVQK